MTDPDPPSTAATAPATDAGVPVIENAGAGTTVAATALSGLPSRAWWGIAAFVVIVIGLVYLIGPILSPFLFGAILAYIGSPLVGWGARRRIPRVLGALFVVTGMIAVLIALILILAPMVQTEIATIARRLPELADRFNERLVPWARERFGVDLQFDAATFRSLVADNVSGVQNIGVWLLGSLKIGGTALVGFFANLLLTPVVMFYLLTDWDRFIAKIGGALPRRWNIPARAIATQIDTVLAEYLRGQVTVMLVLALFYAAGLWFAGLQFAVPIGVLTGLLIFIPYLGYGIGLVLALLVALLQFSSWQGIAGVIAVYGVGQIIESFLLTPWLVGERIGLHPLAVIFALLAFGQLFGFTGVLLALAASAAMLVGLRQLRLAYMASPLYRNA